MLKLLKSFENMTKFMKVTLVTKSETLNNCKILHIIYNVITYYQYLITKSLLLKFMVPVTKMSQTMFFLISKYTFVKILILLKVKKLKFLCDLWFLQVVFKRRTFTIIVVIIRTDFHKKNLNCFIKKCI